jgi:REP-associated tyrosine transposase
MEGTALSVLGVGVASNVRPSNIRGSDGALPSRCQPCFNYLVPPRRKHPVHHSPMERFNEPSIIFLTDCTQERKRILASAEVALLLKDSWLQATSWMVGRFIIMPDHLHLFCAPGELPERPLAQWVRYWKTLAPRRWPRPAQQLIWQLDFWDTQLRKSAHYDEKWEYVRQNPVRAGLVRVREDWPYQGELNELRW